MMVMKSVQELREIHRLYGGAAVLRDCSSRIADKLADFQVLRGMTVRLEDVRDASLFDARGYDARFATEEELMAFAEAGAHEFSVAFLRRASARGDRCYAIFEGDKLASFGWYSSQPTSIDDHFVLHFDGRYSYMYKGFTAPEYRGKRLHAIGMCRALHAVTAEGSRGLISYVHSNNFASLRSVGRMGYRIFGSVYALRTRSVRLTYATPGCREYAFRLEKRPLSEQLSDGALSMKKG